MFLKPKCDAIIYVPNKLGIRVFLTDPESPDVVREIQELSSNKGIRVVKYTHEEGEPWAVNLSPMYDAEYVAHEVEQILRKYGLHDLLIKIDDIDSSRELKTLAEESA